MSKVPVIKIPIFDSAFEFQIRTESPLLKGTVLALYIKRKREASNLKFLSGSDETGTDVDYHWDSYEFEQNEVSDKEITFKVDGKLLNTYGGLNKKYYGQVAIFEKSSGKRMETVQPVKFKTVADLTE